MPKYIYKTKVDGSLRYHMYKRAHKKGFVNEGQYANPYVHIIIKAMHTVKIYVDISNYTVEVKAMCVPCVVWDLFMGNINRTKCPDNLS